MRLPPGPRRPAVLSVWEYVRRPYPFLAECAARFGKRFTLKWSGGRTLVVTWDSADVKQVFQGGPDTYLAGKANERFRAFAGDSTLFALDGPPHARHRRLLMPPFRGERMRAYGQLMADLAADGVRRWPDDRPFSILEPMTEVAVEVIFRAIFGIADAERIARLKGLLGRMTGSTPALLMFVPALQLDFGRLSPWGRFLDARREWDAILQDEIARARAAAGSGREDILAKLLEESARDGEPLTDAELRDELTTLLGAGHETTTAGLAWAFRWILGTPGVLDRLRAELAEVYGDRPFDPAEVGKLKYLDAAVQETLRLTPPIPVVPRWLVKPVKLGEHELPEGTVLCPSPFLVQRDPAIYPDPLRFDPERFVGKRPGPHEFFPFGGGNRICIGLPFAVYEMKVVLAAVLSRCDLALAEAPSEASRRKGIIVLPESGTRVIVRSRRAAGKKSP